MNIKNTLPKLLSNSKTEDLIMKKINGDVDAKNILILHNMKLVEFIADVLTKKAQIKEELISIGHIILVNEVNEFDTPNLDFNLYLFNKLKREIGKYYDDLTFVEIPASTIILENDTNLFDTIYDGNLSLAYCI